MKKCSALFFAIALLLVGCNKITRPPDISEQSNALWHENKDAAVKKTEDELIEKGWSGFDVKLSIDGKHMVMYTITGHVDDRYGNPMTVSVGVAFSESSSDGMIEDVTYKSETGRLYSSTEILYANDHRLYVFMNEDSRTLLVHNKNAAIKKIKSELSEREWDVLQVNAIKEEENELIIEIVGQIDDRYDNAMSINICVVFNSFFPEGEISSVGYRSASDPNRVYGTKELISANDQQLYEYMHGLSIPQIQ